MASTAAVRVPHVTLNGFTFVYIGTKMELIAFGAGGISGDFFAFDPSLGTWLELNSATVYGSPPSNRSGLGLACLAGYLYLFGGQGPRGREQFVFQVLLRPEFSA